MIGDIISEWVRHTRRIFGGPVKTLVFGATVAHAEELCRQWQQLGYDFRLATGKQGGLKSDNINEFKADKCLGLVSCEALAKGLDVPDILCIVNSRPYRKSLAAHIQQVGRGMRASPGKDFCLILDHARNFLRHANATEDFWEQGCHRLDRSDPKKSSKRRKRVEPREQKDRMCRECSMLLDDSRDPCPGCGTPRPRRPRANVDVVPGTMKEYRKKRLKDRKWKDLWPDVSLLAIQKYGNDDKDKALRWAKAQYHSITDSWPRWGIELEPGKQIVNKDVPGIIDGLRRQYHLREKVKARRQERIAS